MTETTNISEVLTNAFAPAANQMPLGLQLDHEKYLPQLAELDIPEGQKVVLLETLWPIMRSFVELGFSSEIHINTCESLSDTFNGAAVITLDDVSYSDVKSTREPASGASRGRAKGLHNG